MRTLQKQIEHDAELVAALPQAQQELLAREVREMLNPPGYTFELPDYA